MPSKHFEPATETGNHSSLVPSDYEELRQVESVVEDTAAHEFGDQYWVKLHVDNATHSVVGEFDQAAYDGSNQRRRIRELLSR